LFLFGLGFLDFAFLIAVCEDQPSAKSNGYYEPSFTSMQVLLNTKVVRFCTVFHPLSTDIGDFGLNRPNSCKLRREKCKNHAHKVAELCPEFAVFYVHVRVISMSEEPRRGHKRLVIITIIIVLLALAGSTAWWFFKVRDVGPIPKKYTRDLKIKLYYPTRLPEGYSVNVNSFERQDDVLIFSIKAPNGKNVAVAQQAIPPDAPARTNKRTPIPLPSEKSFQTGIGAAQISLWGDKFVSDIITSGGTWIIMNVSGFTMDEATTVSQSFTEL
jgi:hypothetical protein